MVVSRGPQASRRQHGSGPAKRLEGESRKKHHEVSAGTGVDKHKKISALVYEQQASWSGNGRDAARVCVSETRHTRTRCLCSLCAGQQHDLPSAFVASNCAACLKVLLSRG